MKILSSFTLLQVVPNLYEFICSAEHKGRYYEECGKQSSSGAPLTFIVFFPTKEVNSAPKQPGYKLSSEYLPLCSADQINYYRFGTTWGWVNDKIFIFGWTIPLSICCECLYFTWVFKFQPTLTFTPLHILIKMYTFTLILFFLLQYKVRRTQTARKQVWRISGLAFAS